MKITLISPFPTLEAIGLRTLSSCLKNEGHKVQILFLRHEFWQRYSPAVLQEAAELSKDSDLIGISVITNFYDNVIDVTSQLRKTTKAPIIWGGMHPTIRPDESLQHANMVCFGEGEDSLLELVKKMDRGQDYRDVRGFWFRDNGKIIRNPLHPLQMNLDLIPLPDYNYEDHFVRVKDKIEKMDLKLAEKFLGREDRDYMILAGRGCPFGCAYCGNNTLHKMDKDYRLVRKRSPANLIQELIEAKKKLPYIRSIKFSDDAFFTYPEKDIREFCEGYKTHIQLPLRIKGIHPSSCNRAKLAMFADAGCDAVRMGIETCSEKTKSLYHRNYSGETIVEAVNMINEFRGRIDDVQFDIILDNPWESEDDLIATLMMLAKFKPPYYLALFSLTFYPETELYHRAKREGLIKDDLKDVYRKFYRNTRNTFINKLFHLLNMYALMRQQFPQGLMAPLTSRFCRRFGISYVLYALLLAEIKLHRMVRLFVRGAGALAKGDLGDLKQGLRRTFAFLR